MRHIRLAASALTFLLALAPCVAGAAEATEPAATTAPSDVAQADQFKDVPPNSEAYRAIQQLAKSGIIKGYPDGAFKGQRPITRYEAALITERAVEYMKTQLASPQTAPSVTEADLNAVRSLLDSFRGDIVALKYRVGEDEKVLKAHSDQLARQQQHVLLFVRAPGTFREELAAYNRFGTPLGPVAANTLTFNNKLGSGVSAGQNKAIPGKWETGSGYQVLRAFFDGNVDSRTAYHFRLENRYYYSNANLNNGAGIGTSSTTPQYCPNAACASDYPSNSTMRLNYANITYKDPSGFDATVGRYVQQTSGLGLNVSDYFNGAIVGYSMPKVGLAGHVGYGFNFGQTDNCAASAVLCGSNSSTFWAALDYAPPAFKAFSANATLATDSGQQLALWNPAFPTLTGPGGVVLASGAYRPVNTPITVGSLYGKYQFTKQLTAELEGAHRFGKDPFTGASWAQPDALWGQLKYGNTGGAVNANYVEGGFIQAGFNSLSGHTNVVGTTNYEQFYLSNPNGYRIGYVGGNHWFSKNARLGLYYVHFDLIPGTDMPAGSTGCPGCYITHDIGNGLFLQTLLSF